MSPERTIAVFAFVERMTHESWLVAASEVATVYNELSTAPPAEVSERVLHAFAAFIAWRAELESPRRRAPEPEPDMIGTAPKARGKPRWLLARRRRRRTTPAGT